jgi:hypothetical protein
MEKQFTEECMVCEKEMHFSSNEERTEAINAYIGEMKCPTCQSGGITDG